MNNKLQKLFQIADDLGLTFRDIREAFTKMSEEDYNSEMDTELLKESNRNFKIKESEFSNAEIEELIYQARPEELFDYLNEVEDRDDVRQALIDAGDPEYLLYYLLNIEDRDDVRQALIDTGNLKWLFEYLRLIDCNNSEVFTKFLEQSYPEFLLDFFQEFGYNDKAFRKFISEADSGRLFDYLDLIEWDDEVYQAIVNSGDQYFIDKANNL